MKCTLQILNPFKPRLFKICVVGWGPPLGVIFPRLISVDRDMLETGNLLVV